MLLRRITKHVTEQNWFAVFIDFLIVVIGILIAFQITEWNESRGERERVNEILYELRTDLNADINLYTAALDSTLNRISAGEYIATLAPDAALTQWEEKDKPYQNGALPSYASLLDKSEELKNKSFAKRVPRIQNNLWEVLIDVFNPPSNSASFDSLINSGELGLFENQELVSAIQDYRFWTSGLAGMQDNTIRPMRNSVTEIGQLYGLSAFGKINEKQFIELVKNNPQLAAVIQTELGRAKRHFRIKALVKESAISLVKLIEKELGIESDSDDSKADQ